LVKIVHYIELKGIKSDAPLYQQNRITYAILGFSLFLVACSPTKDKWMNRKWHTLTGHYNIYFNGQQKVLDAEIQLEASHVNNFNQVLDVFPLGTPEAAKGAANILDEASKKFSGTIQLHQIGSYTDDAYFGIAQCHFYKRDYFAAIEAFQYVGNKYKKGDYRNLCNSWIARCYVGLEKLGEAEAVISSMLTEKNYTKKEISHIFTTAADINIKLGKYSSAIENLKMALTGSLNKEQKIRYHYILGQLCMEADKKPEAIVHFDKVLKLIPSYDFAFNANINLTKVYDLSNKKNVAKVRRNLKRMANDDKNEDYLDQIYFELGKLEWSQKNEVAAIKDFKLSVAKSTKNRAQKAKSYKELAVIFFDKKDYVNAQAYYDSTVQSLDPKEKDYEQLKNTQLVLKDLVSNLNAYETEDSLQALSRLSKDALDKKVSAWMSAEKLRQEQEAKQKKKNEQIAASMQNNSSNQINSGPAPLPGAGSASWYFYNSTLMVQGSSEFFSARKWGRRANEDFWRIASKEKIKSNDEDAEKQNTPSDTLNKKDGGEKQTKTIAEVVENKTFGDATKDAWVKNVPFTKEKLESSNNRIMESLNNLGSIYYEKLKNNTEAIKYLNELEKRFPLNEYEPKAYYYLHKSYVNLEQKGKAEEFKNLLIKEYPEHPYTMFLQKKVLKNTEAESNKELNKEYEKMLDLYKTGSFAEAMDLKEQFDKKFPGNSLKPKYEYLNALCIGKLKGKEQLKSSMTTILSAYPNTEVGESAKAILAAMNKEEKKASIVGTGDSSNQVEYDLETETPFYYVFAVKNEKADLTDYLSLFGNHNEAYNSNDNLRVNSMMSNEGYQLILIREFKNLAAANLYLETLSAIKFADTKLMCKEPYLQTVISIKNFRNALKDKKLESYSKFYPKLAASLNKKKN
jgi:tetratricopeptide (TPR) repeat protein